MKLVNHALKHLFAVATLATALVVPMTSAYAAETLNVYSIWPENWARPMLLEFEKASEIGRAHV